MGRKCRLPILPSPHFSPVFYCGGKGLQAFVATVPLDEQAWTPLAHGKIACFERGLRVR